MHKPSSETEGSKNEPYDIYVPFILNDSKFINVIDREELLFGHNYKLILEKLANKNHYAITLGDFSSHGKAFIYLNKLYASLLWFSLNFKCGIRYKKEIGKVYLFDQPLSKPEIGWNSVDGNYDASMTLIRPKGKKLVSAEGGLASVSIGVSFDKFMTTISQALSFPNSEHVINKKKLLLAIEIYAGTNFELSKKSKYLSLMTALEALQDDTKIPKHSEDVLQILIELITSKRNEHEKDTKKWKDIEHLLSRVGKLKFEGPLAGIRKYALEVAAQHPELGDTEKSSRMLGKAYDVRSKLLHTGEIFEEDLENSLQFLQDYVPNLLKFLFRAEAGSM